MGRFGRAAAWILIVIALGSLWVFPGLLRGAISGLMAAFLVGVWTLVRGMEDSLLAPYGFDILVLVIVLGAAMVMLNANPFGRAAALHG